MKTYYYNVSIFYDRKNNFSMLVKIKSNDVLSSDDVISHLVSHNMIDKSEAKHFDKVNEITKEEYEKLVGSN